MQVPADMCVHLVGVINLLPYTKTVCSYIFIECLWLDQHREVVYFLAFWNKAPLYSLMFTSDGTIHVSADRRSPCICGSQFHGLVAQNGPHGVGKCARGGKSFNL